VTSYQLRFPSRSSIASVHFKGNGPSRALAVAQRLGARAELVADGCPLCSIEIDKASGYWVISPSTSAAA
jgi:hypothetical protein